MKINIWGFETIIFVPWQVNIVNGINKEWDHLSTEEVLSNNIDVSLSEIFVVRIELLHETNKVLDMLIHFPSLLLGFATDEAVSCTDLSIDDQEICEAVPGEWVMDQAWNSTCCLIDLVLVRSHLTKEVGACRASLLSSDPDDQWIFLPIMSRIKKHVEHILTIIVVDWEVT